MRKRKNNKSDLALEMVDNQSISTPSPDFGMKYKGADMYWYPEVQKPEKTTGTIEELLSSTN
jgi:hypothetical protein